MKLDAAQLPKVEQQLGVNAIPEEHPIISDLKEVFGDHTFFVDAAGIMIVVPKPMTEKPIGNVVKVAAWTSEERTELLTHEPEVLELTVDLESDRPDPIT